MTTAGAGHRHRDSRGDRGCRRPTAILLAERVTLDARAHAERITPNVLAALADAGRCDGGPRRRRGRLRPGPFTGLRVGMATAAAYGHALGIPVYGVCSLDAIGGQTTGEVLVVTDARRREIYWARYRDGVRIDGPAVSAPADVDAGARAVGRRLAGPCGAVRAAVRRTAVPRRRPAWWPRWPTGRRSRRPRGAAVPAAAGRQDAGRAGGSAMTAAASP